MSATLDNADRILLEKLQDNANCNLDILTDACGLSVASVHRRLKRLREQKVIEREVAVLNPSALDHAMTFIVMVEMESDRREYIDAFRKAALAEPLIQQCYYVTGEADFTLICLAKDMPEFEALTHRLFFDGAHVQRFRTSVVMGRTKVGLSVPTDAHKQ